MQLLILNSYLSGHQLLSRLAEYLSHASVQIQPTAVDSELYISYLPANEAVVILFRITT